MRRPNVPNRRPGPAATAALMVVAACAVVAVAASDVGMLTPPVVLGAGGLTIIRMVGLVVTAAGLVALLAQRRRLLTAEDRRYDPAVAGVLAAATIMIVLYTMALLAPGYDRSRDPFVINVGSTVEEEEPPDLPGRDEEPDGFLSGGMGTPAIAGEDRRIEVLVENDGGDTSFAISDEAARAILFAMLLALGVLALVTMLRRRRRPPEEPEEDPIDTDEVEAGLEASMADVADADRDPRPQIIAAYDRLLAALTAAGAPRRPHEAPHEHLYRVLTRLGVEPEPMHRLTALYVAARFSEQPVTEQHRVAAGDALEAALADLRTHIANAGDAANASAHA